ncbi:MAG: hypothetical protein ACP5L4_02005 [Thermoplasmata archaeon]
MNEKLKIDEIILLLLNEGKIRGKSILQMEVFLVWKEIFKGENMENPMFQPNFYGPYSSLLEDLIYKLIIGGYVKNIPRGESHTTYIITEKGKSLVEKILGEKKIPDKIQEIKEKKVDWDELTFQGLVRYIYRNYPEYTLKIGKAIEEWK